MQNQHFGARDWVEFGRVLTLLFFGVQLGDADGETVHALLQGVNPEGEGVGLIKELSKQILCIFTCSTCRQAFEFPLLFQHFIIIPLTKVPVGREGTLSGYRLKRCVVSFPICVL